MTLDLFSSLEADVMRAVETSRDPQIFPPFPTRNDFSGNEQGAEIANFPTFPTFPTENEGFVETGRVDDASLPACGMSGEDIEGKSAGASSISPAKSGKVGNPCSSKERKWEKWENPVAPSRPADLQEAFEERAADLQYGEGLLRDEAERLAVEQTGWRPPQRPSNVVALRPANWKPETSAGVRITVPAREVDAAEYDAHLDAMISNLPAGSNERSHLTFAKRKGWVIDRGNERIYTKGRT